MTWEMTPDEHDRWKVGNEDEKSFWLELDEDQFLAQEEGYRRLAIEAHGFEIVERYSPQPSGKGDESYRHCFYAKSVGSRG